MYVNSNTIKTLTKSIEKLTKKVDNIQLSIKQLQKTATKKTPNVNPNYKPTVEWTNTEEELLITELASGISITDIATKHGRTVNAIISRIIKIIKILLKLAHTCDAIANRLKIDVNIINAISTSGPNDGKMIIQLFNVKAADVNA